MFLLVQRYASSNIIDNACTSFCNAIQEPGEYYSMSTSIFIYMRSCTFLCKSDEYLYRAYIIFYIFL